MEKIKLDYIEKMFMNMNASFKETYHKSIDLTLEAILDLLKKDCEYNIVLYSSLDGTSSNNDNCDIVNYITLPNSEGNIELESIFYNDDQWCVQDIYGFVADIMNELPLHIKQKLIDRLLLLYFDLQ